MTTQRFLPAAPLGPDGPYLVAILGALDEIRDLLADRLPTATGGPVPVGEPAPRPGPGKAIPVQEPAPGRPPDDKDEDEAQPPTAPAPAGPEPPPRAGRGASADAWRTWANRAGVATPRGATRDDIIAACEQAGVLTAKT